MGPWAAQREAERGSGGDTRGRESKVAFALGRAFAFSGEAKPQLNCGASQGGWAAGGVRRRGSGAVGGHGGPAVRGKTPTPSGFREEGSQGLSGPQPRPAEGSHFFRSLVQTGSLYASPLPPSGFWDLAARPSRHREGDWGRGKACLSGNK